MGPGGIEPPTSPLSGVRSSHLSYGPRCSALHWWSWSGSNRRPPECKSGALPAELQPLFQEVRSQNPEDSVSCLLTSDSSLFLSRPVGYRGRGSQTPNHFQIHSQNFKWRSGSVLTTGSVEPVAVYGMERLLPTRSRRTLRRFQLSETPSTVSLRKEVIQPQVLLRLPCYDFTPIMDHTLGRCPPCGSACRLLVQSTFVM